MDSHYDSSGKPIFEDICDQGNDEFKKVYLVKNKALFMILVKRHIRAILFRIKKLRK